MLMVMKSSVYPSVDSEYEHSSSYEFDPLSDFTQFLEEAKKYAKENKMQSKATQYVEKQEIKTKKKSWKTPFFSFWKSSSNKKNETKSGSKNYPKRSGYFSGPVWPVAGDGQRVRYQVSGSLMGLFNQMKSQEWEKNEIAYVSLESLNRPAYDAKTYGPLYLVS